MAMNTGTKLMLGLGAIGIVVGILVMVLGAGSIGDASKWRPTDDVYLENSQGETVIYRSGCLPECASGVVVCVLGPFYIIAP